MRPIPPPVYPPGAAGFWEACRPAGMDSACAEWIQRRGLNLGSVEVWGLARALPSVGALPRWASSWRIRGYKLLLPLYDAEGVLRSLRARLVRADSCGPKELAPSRFAARGLVLACHIARRMLAGSSPDWWRPEILVVEGVPDWLTWASRQSDAHEGGPAVLGIGAGSWSPEVAERIPDGSRVMLRGHAGAAGEHYMETIAASLAGRFEVYGGGL